MAKFRALVSKFPYNIIQYTYRIILFLLLKKVCSSFYYSYSSFTKQMKKFLIVQNKKYRKSFFSSISKIIQYKYWIILQGEFETLARILAMRLA